MKNRKHFQSLEIYQRAQYLQGFAFQYLEKKEHMEIQKIARKKNLEV